jgi:hypothetical protein
MFKPIVYLLRYRYESSNHVPKAYPSNRRIQDGGQLGLGADSNCDRSDVIKLSNRRELDGTVCCLWSGCDDRCGRHRGFSGGGARTRVLAPLSCFANQRRATTARATLDWCLLLEPGATIETVSTQLPFKRPEDMERYLDGLRRAGLSEGQCPLLAEAVEKLRSELAARNILPTERRCR